jgi:hypothetical protein
MFLDKKRKKKVDVHKRPQKQEPFYDEEEEEIEGLIFHSNLDFKFSFPLKKVTTTKTKPLMTPLTKMSSTMGTPMTPTL